MMYCRYCGKEIKDGSKFCPYCGKSLNEIAVKEQVKSKKKSGVPRGWKIAIPVFGLVLVAGSILIIGFLNHGSAGDSDSNLTSFSENPIVASKKAKESGNVLSAHPFGFNVNDGSISIISFQDTLKDMPEDAWDASENQDGSVMAWVKQNEDSNELIVAGEGGVDANPDSSYLFAQYSGSYINFNDCFYTGNVQNMYSMFRVCIHLRDLDLSGWDTSNVTDMSYMFSACGTLEELDLSGWDTSSVENMSSMFNDCYCLKEIDVSGWDTSSVTDMSVMFHCAVESLDVSGWDTSSVTNMYYMFGGCSALGSLDVSGWDTSNVTNMADMFNYCKLFQSLDVSNWDTSNVTDMSYMFVNCAALENLDVSNWDTSNVTDMSYLFTNCYALENLDVSNWDTSNVTDMSYMFASCFALQGPDIREWDMTQADITEMLDETGAKWEDSEISDGDSSPDTEIETFENNGSNSLSLAYIEQLFSDRDMPFSYEGSEEYTYDKIYCEGFWELTYYESGILDFAFAGADATYDIAFYNDVTSGDGFISDINGTKMVTATLEGSDDFNMSEQEIINDIIEAEYGEDLLDIAHILYGSEFEKDIAAIKEITENGNYSHTEFSITDAIVYTEGNVSDNFNSGKLGETVNKIRYVIDTDYPSVTVSKSEIVGKIVYTD